MNKIKIILPVSVIIIIVVMLAIGQFKITDLFSSGDEFYNNIYEAYENFEDVNIDDKDKIATFDFNNYAFIIHYFDNDMIKISFVVKEEDKYKYSGEGITIEEKYITKEFQGNEFSHNGDRIECDIVSNDADISDEYIAEEIKLNNKKAIFVYRHF